MHPSFLARYSMQAKGALESEKICDYRKVASSRLSRLVAHFHIFRLFMKGKFDAYVLLAKSFQN